VLDATALANGPLLLAGHIANEGRPRVDRRARKVADTGPLFARSACREKESAKKPSQPTAAQEISMESIVLLRHPFFSVVRAKSPDGQTADRGWSLKCPGSSGIASSARAEGRSSTYFAAVTPGLKFDRFLPKWGNAPPFFAFARARRGAMKS
jgi:hypothetical protein